MFDYENYLAKEDSLSFEEALKIINQFFAVADFSDDIIKELFEDILEAGSKYVKMRNDWNFFSKEEKEQKDAYRTSLHNNFLTTLTPLARYMEKEGADISWYEELTEKKEIPSRKRLGDFSGYLLLVGTLKAR